MRRWTPSALSWVRSSEAGPFRQRDRGQRRVAEVSRDEAQALFKQSAEYGEKATKMNPTSAEFLKIYGDSCDILFRNFHVGEFADKAIASYTAGSDVETKPSWGLRPRLYAYACFAG